jgi:hypothetical protein
MAGPGSPRRDSNGPAAAAILIYLGLSLRLLQVGSSCCCR